MAKILDGVGAGNVIEDAYVFKDLSRRWDWSSGLRSPGRGLGVLLTEATGVASPRLPVATVVPYLYVNGGQPEEVLMGWGHDLEVGGRAWYLSPSVVPDGFFESLNGPGNLGWGVRLSLLRDVTGCRVTLFGVG